MGLNYKNTFYFNILIYSRHTKQGKCRIHYTRDH